MAMKFIGGQNLGAFKSLAFTVLAVVALGLCQIWLWAYVGQVAETLHSRQTEEQQLQDLESRIISIENTYEGQLPLLDQLTVVFPKDSETSQVVDRLEQLADKQGVTLDIKDISNKADVPKDSTLLPVAITCHLTGTATKLMQYLGALEHIQELAVVRSWGLSVAPPLPVPPAGAPVSAGPTHQKTMNVVFYLQR